MTPRKLPKKSHRYKDESDRIAPDGFCSVSHKDYWLTEEQAAAALEAAKRRGVGRGGKLEKRYYRCPWCPGYHLSSKEATEDPLA